ncbi:MAG: transposase, partial [Candidatus Lokiarchaeota archaeon]|nr:transposase [Candidatus Lokiarchaeota archaeon]
MHLNRDLDQYVECVRWYLSFKPTSRNKLHKDTYKNAKERFELKMALLQSARDKAVEIYKSFENVKGKDSELHLRK